jgi:hypothetical protein
VLRHSNSPPALQLKRAENKSSVINRNRKEVGGRVMSKQNEESIADPRDDAYGNCNIVFTAMSCGFDVFHIFF